MTTRCRENGPADVPPGPWVSRTVPDTSTARPPVLRTTAVTYGCPFGDLCPAIEVTENLVGGAPSLPIAR